MTFLEVASKELDGNLLNVYLVTILKALDRSRGNDRHQSNKQLMLTRYHLKFQSLHPIQGQRLKGKLGGL